MNRRVIKKNGLPIKSEPQSLALKNIKSVRRFRFKRLSSLSYFASIHIRDWSVAYSFTYTVMADQMPRIAGGLTEQEIYWWPYFTENYFIFSSIIITSRLVNIANDILYFHFKKRRPSIYKSLKILFFFQPLDIGSCLPSTMWTLNSRFPFCFQLFTLFYASSQKIGWIIKKLIRKYKDKRDASPYKI